MNSGSDPDANLPTFTFSACGFVENVCFEVAAGGITNVGVSVFAVFVQLGEVAGEGGVLGRELGSSALVRDLIPLPPHNTHT